MTFILDIYNRKPNQKSCFEFAEKEVVFHIYFFFKYLFKININISGFKK